MLTWPVVLSTFILRPAVDASTSKFEFGSMVVGFVPILTCPKETDDTASPRVNTNAENNVVVFIIDFFNRSSLIEMYEQARVTSYNPGLFCATL
jgi:hypothetical protein